MLVLREPWVFLIFFDSFIEYCLFSGGGFAFFVHLLFFVAVCVYPFITLVSCFVYFGCAGSVRISLAGWVIYFLCGTPLCGVPGRYNLFEC